MTRALLAASALLLVSAGFASASDLVPGSDLAVREADARAGQSVITGPSGSVERSEASYGYQSGRTVRFESYAPAGEAARPAAVSLTRTVLVPGSDSF